MLEKFLEAAQELGNQARAENDAGCGISTAEDKLDFIEFFEKKIKDVLDTFEKIKKD